MQIFVGKVESCEVPVPQRGALGGVAGITGSGAGRTPLEVLRTHGGVPWARGWTVLQSLSCSNIAA